MSFRARWFGNSSNFAATLHERFDRLYVPGVTAASYIAATAAAAAMALGAGIEAACSTCGCPTGVPAEACVVAALDVTQMDTFYGPVAFRPCTQPP